MKKHLERDRETLRQAREYEAARAQSEIEQIKTMFLSYGFLRSPLSDADIAKLKAERFTSDTIYEIGCDISALQFDTIDEAIACYTKGN